MKLRMPRSTNEGFGRYSAVLAVLVLMFVVLSLTQDRFLTEQNIKNLLTSVSVVSICALGMTFVILTAGIDLSVGGILAMAGIFLAKVLGLGVPGVAAVLLTILFGMAIGALFNGFLIGKAGLSFFVVTLGVSTALAGLVNIWSDNKTTYVTSTFVNNLGFSELLGVPVPIWIMLAALLGFLWVQKRTYFGRDVYAVGGNVEAARLSGIRVAGTTMAVYAISGACAGLAGAIQTGRLGAASPLVGTDTALAAIAAVLLGGTTFAGGVGGVAGTAVGVLFIGVLQNGLGLAGVSGYWQQVVTGVILVSAIGMDRLRQAGGTGRWRRGPDADITGTTAEAAWQPEGSTPSQTGAAKKQTV
jgi:ribose transport system permease protein